MSIRQSIVLVFAVTLLLGGCASIEPTASEPDAAAPSPEAPFPSAGAQHPVVRTVLAGHAFSTVLSDGTVVEEVPYSTDPAVARARLSEVFGDLPEVSTGGAEHCSPAFVRSSWSEALIMSTDFRWLSEGQLFSLSAMTAGLRAVGFATPAGMAVGDDIGPLVATLPVAQVDSTEFEGISYVWALYEVAGCDFVEDDFRWGAQASAEYGLIDAIHAPVSPWASEMC